LHIEQLKKSDEKVWDDYVMSHDGALFSHLMGWRDVVTNVYGLEPFYLAAKENGVLTGILPLFFMKHWYFGKKLISMPYAVSGGVCADSEQIESLLIERAITQAKDLNVDYLELRHFRESRGELVARDKYFTFLIELGENPDDVWKNIHRNTTRYIKRGLEQDFEIDMADDDVSDFYRVYARGQRDLGTPVSGYRWIKQLFDAFPENHRIARVRYQGKTIASVFVREFKDTLYPTVGYALKEYRNLYPFYTLIWKLIEEGCQRGFKWLDFGRSIKESGTYQYKIWWGAQPVPLHYQYHFHKTTKMFDTSQSNPIRKRFAKVWKKIPLPVANTMGPLIRKYYP
jgi:FemAB-related protein (PEP-CTERM system-associated)